jgi:ubiquinone/menaquinone biosynthesis C-methylase UbiE
MEQSHAQFVGTIPEIYHRHLGPVLFAPASRDLAGRLGNPPPRRVLELACGTGILTRELRVKLPPSSSLVATDLNEAMVDFARSQLAGDRGIEWRTADMASLPFPDRAFDAVVCQHGLMFAEDKPAALRETHRVLEPGGFAWFSVWDSRDRNHWARDTHETLANLFPENPPTFYETPFGMHDADAVSALFRGTGFVDVTPERVHLRSEASSAADLARGLIEGNPVQAAIRERGTVPVERVVDEVARVLARDLGEKPARLDLNLIVFSARREKK